MIVNLIINRERTGGGVFSVLLDTEKLKNYTPSNQFFPKNLDQIIESKDWIEIFDQYGDEDWLHHEYDNLLKSGVIQSPISKTFEIAYC